MKVNMSSGRPRKARLWLTRLTNTRLEKMTGSAWRNLNLEDVGDASFALAGNQLDDMEIEPELKDFFNKQLSVKR